MSYQNLDMIDKALVMGGSDTPKQWRDLYTDLLRGCIDAGSRCQYHAGLL